MNISNLKILSENQIKKLVREEISKHKIYCDKWFNELNKKLMRLEEEIRAVKIGKRLI